MAQKFGFSTTGEEAAEALKDSIQGKIVLITGVTPGGLGLETARAISLANPQLLILAGRSTSTLSEAEAVVSKTSPDVKTRPLVLDLGSQSQIRKAAADVMGWDDVDRLDVVINNAGIMAIPFGKTEDGIEKQFGVNHIGHFLFTQLVIEKILKGREPRVVNLSSNGYKMGGVRFDDWNFEDGKAYDRWQSYGQSKTANILYAKALTARYGSRGLRAYSVHPGGIWTNLGHHAKDDLKAMGFMDDEGNVKNTETMKWKTLGQGVSTSIVAAFDPAIKDQSGAWLADCAVTETPEDFASNPEAPEKLWKLSEKLVGQTFD